MLQGSFVTMFFFQSLNKKNQLGKYFIIALLTFGWLTVCRGGNPVKIKNGVGKWSDDYGSATLFYNTNNLDPELFLKLETSTELHLKIGNIKEVIRLESRVKWPLEWLIDHTSGAVKIKLKKEKLQNWSTLTADTSKPIVDKLFWAALIKETNKISEDSYLVRIQTADNVFLHVPLARHIALRKTEEAPENETKPYTTVPIIEDAMKLTSETWRSSAEMINLLIKGYPGRFMSPYVTKSVPNGMSIPIYVSNARGPFLPSNLQGKKKVFLFAAGTGITPMISIIVWVLKYQT